jgi:hypothetical protein
MMARFVLPAAASIPSQRCRVTLDRREYVLDLRWSMREERWYLDVRDAAGSLLVGSIKIVTAWPLLRRFRAVVGLPPGDIIVLDGRAGSPDPGLADLGSVAELIYLDAAELAALAPTATSVSTGGGAPGGIGEMPI